jgi:AcrR family transcriptional regulator
MIVDAGRELIREKGIEGIRARPIADKIGYAVGTLYNVFDDLDDIVEFINADTAKRLFEACTREPLPEGPGPALFALASRYREFVKENGQLWRSVVAYPFSVDHQRSEPYSAEIEKIFKLIVVASAPLYAKGEEQLQLHDARVLWSCLYGVQALSEESRYPTGTSVEKMLTSIVSMYVGSRKLAQQRDK